MAAAETITVRAVHEKGYGLGFAAAAEEERIGFAAAGEGKEGCGAAAAGGEGEGIRFAAAGEE